MSCETEDLTSTNLLQLVQGQCRNSNPGLGVSKPIGYLCARLCSIESPRNSN